MSTDRHLRNYDGQALRPGLDSPPDPTRFDNVLKLTESQRRMLSTRLMLQMPVGLTPRQIKNVANDLDRRVRGLPPGAFMALDALRLLAEQGNQIADLVFRVESERLGLTEPFRVVIKGG